MLILFDYRSVGEVERYVRQVLCESFIMAYGSVLYNL